MHDETYLETVRREFGRLKELADGAIVQLDDEQFFKNLSEIDNSVAVTAKHLAGNMLSRWRNFLTTDGEKPDRNRDSEFVISESDTRAVLLHLWETGWQCLFDALNSIDEDDLGSTVQIRRERHSVMQAINRQLTHYAYHVGQIVFLARHLAGAGWKTLSVPKGYSNLFNEAPKSYLDESNGK